MIEKALLPAGLAFIMFAMGLGLRFSDFKAVLRAPLALFLGLFFQIILLPAAAFALLLIWPLPPEFAVGVMILAACPGGITSNLLTSLARGDTALSISLTAITSLAGMLSVPLIVNFALFFFEQSTRMHDLPVWKMALGVFMVSTLPVVAGMALNHGKPAIAAGIKHYARPLATGIFILIVIGAFASQWSVMISGLKIIGKTIITLNAGIMLVSFLGAMAAGLALRQRIAIAMESGLQNGALGIFVALSLLDNTAMMLPSITYALIMNASAAIFIITALQMRSFAAD